jgi:hypothetical protein
MSLPDEDKRANLYFEVYCNYDGEQMDIAKVEMEGHRFKVKVRACPECMRRNRLQGVDLAIAEIKEAAKKPLKVMEELQS